MQNVIKKFKKGSNDVKKRIVSQLGSNLTLFDKSLYFKRENALWLIKDCANAYTYEKGRLEPKNSVVNKGDLGVFDALYPVLLEQLNAIRTYQKDNL